MFQEMCTVALMPGLARHNRHLWRIAALPPARRSRCIFIQLPCVSQRRLALHPHAHLLETALAGYWCSSNRSRKGQSLSLRDPPATMNPLSFNNSQKIIHIPYFGHGCQFCTGMQRKEIARSERTVLNVRRASDRALLTRRCAQSASGFRLCRKQACAVQR